MMRQNRHRDTKNQRFTCNVTSMSIFLSRDEKRYFLRQVCVKEAGENMASGCRSPVVLLPFERNLKQATRAGTILVVVSWSFLRRFVMDGLKTLVRGCVFRYAQRDG